MSSLSTACETLEKKPSNEKVITKRVVSVNNSLAELTISSNTPYLTTYNINEKNPKEQETAHHLAGGIFENIRTPHNPVTGGNVSSNSQPSKARLNSSTIRILQHKQELFEEVVQRFPTCDVKIQELLKFIRKDKELWGKIEGNLEIRVIKVKHEDEEIVLHPRNERKIRWSGKYHVYLTINSEGKRLIIDPYIRGEKSCVHVDERDFMKLYWKGNEGKEYVLETIAPITEIYSENGNYTPEFSIHDYIDNFFDPDTFESHKFFYE